MDSEASLKRLPVKVSTMRAVSDRFVLLGSLLSSLGWVLSLFGILNQFAYGLGLGFVVCLFVWLQKRLGISRARSWRLELRRLRRRIRQPIVAAYVLIWCGAFLGGALYAPSNYDALSYRIPQLLHWIAEGGWHWIDAANSRMNIAPPGMNWLIAPFYFLTKSDRLWFLLNLAAFSFLPGCLFELFRRAGASPRAAWWFMWLVPCGYAFALQAGSIGNDLLGAMYVAAGVALALRARTSHQVADVWLSGLAIALANGIKSINLPLLIPWAIAVWPGLKLTTKRLPATAAMVAIAILSSCLPTVLLNIRETGVWTGDPTDEHRVRQPSSGVGLVSNLVLLAVANTQPPLLPNISTWNQRIERWLSHTPLDAWCRAAPRFEVRWGELPTEEMASMGPGVGVVSGLCLLAFIRRRRFGVGPCILPAWGIALAGWLSFLLFLARFSSEAIGRLSVSFIPVLLVPVLLFARRSAPFRGKWTRRLTVFCAALSLPALLLSPARPLIPVVPLLEVLGPERFPRLTAVYSTYARRPDCYSPLFEKLESKMPAELWFVGGADDPEAPAWKPLNTRSVRQWTAIESSSEAAIPSKERIVLASELGIRERFGLSVDDFIEITGADELARADLNIRAARGPERWYLFRVSSPPR